MVGVIMKSIGKAAGSNIVLLTVLVLGLSACLSGGDSSSVADGSPVVPPPVVPGCPRPAPVPPAASAPVGGSCVADASTDYLAADFYVDAAGGNDANNGLTAGTAWQTLSKALTSAAAGKTVFVLNGNYGVLQETIALGRTSYLTLRAAPGHSPIVTKINIDYAAKQPAFLRFVGFSIQNTDRDPDNGSLVSFKDATDIELLNNTISSVATRGSGYAIASLTPGNPSTIDGIGLDNTDRITIKSNCISGVFRGIQLAGSSAVSLLRNYISPQSGSGIQYLSNNSNVLIQDNHIRGMNFTPYCVDAPLPASAALCVTVGDPNSIFDPHDSMISVRSNDLTVRNNIVHGLGSTSGIRFYVPDITGGRTDYSNITIEGNLIYDARNTQVLQMTGVADNVLVRNNTVISQYTTGACITGSPIGVTNDARFRYSTALNVISIAPGKDGSGLSVVNNVFVGATLLGGALAADKKNIFWSYAPTGTTFSATSLSGNSKIVTSAFLGCGNAPTYFETGFFAAAPNYIPNHGLFLNYKPAATSEAVGFGDATSQLPRILGSLDVNNFFINDGGDRCTWQNSAGAYEP
jgi:hypothetical protein